MQLRSVRPGLPDKTCSYKSPDVILFNEVKCRNVIRVAIAFAVAARLVVQVIDVVLPILEIPNWVAKLVLLLLVLGFLVALVISRAWEITPEGLRREPDVRLENSVTHQWAKKLDWITIVLLLIVGALVLFDRFIPETKEGVPDSGKRTRGNNR